MIRRSTRLRFAIAASLRRVRPNRVTALTTVALAFVWLGLAMVSVPLAFVVTGALLVLLTPIGAALRIMIRGR